MTKTSFRNQKPAQFVLNHCMHTITRRWHSIFRYRIQCANALSDGDIRPSWRHFLFAMSGGISMSARDCKRRHQRRPISGSMRRRFLLPTRNRWRSSKLGVFDAIRRFWASLAISFQVKIMLWKWDSLFGQRPRREPEGTKSCRIQGLSVRPSIHPPLPCLRLLRGWLRPPRSLLRFLRGQPRPLRGLRQPLRSLCPHWDGL